MDSTNEASQTTYNEEPVALEELDDLIAELAELDPAAAAEPAATIARRLSQALEEEDR